MWSGCVFVIGFGYCCGCGFGCRIWYLSYVWVRVCGCGFGCCHSCGFCCRCGWLLMGVCLVVGEDAGVAVRVSVILGVF